MNNQDGMHPYWLGGTMLVLAVALFSLAFLNLPFPERQSPSFSSDEGGAALDISSFTRKDDYTGWIAFESDRDGGGYFVLNRDTHEIQRLADPEIYHRSQDADRYSPASGMMVNSQRSGQNIYDFDIFAQSSSSGWVQPVVSHVGPDVDPAWSPTMARIAYISEIDGNKEIRIYDMNTGDDVRITYTPQRAETHPSWSPDGDFLVFSQEIEGQQQLWLVRHDGSDRTRLLEDNHNNWNPVWLKVPAQITPTSGVDDRSNLVIQAKVVECSDYQLNHIDYLVWDASGGKQPITRIRIEVDGKLIRDSGEISSPRVHSDLYISLTNTVDPKDDSFILKISAWNTGGYLRLPKTHYLRVDCPAVDAVSADIFQYLPQPTFVPVGEAPTPLPTYLFKDSVLFISDRSGEDALYLMGPDGLTPRVVDRDPNLAYYRKQAVKAQISSVDGDRLIYSDYFGSSRDLFIFNLKSGTVSKLTDTELNEEDPAWSPDGQSIVYSAKNPESGESNIMLMTFPDLRTTQLTDNRWEEAGHPTWSTDGKKIYFHSNKEGGVKQIWVMDADGENARNLSKNEHNDRDPIFIKGNINFVLPTPTPTPELVESVLHNTVTPSP